MQARTNKLATIRLTATLAFALTAGLFARGSAAATSRLDVPPLVLQPRIAAGD